MDEQEQKDEQFKTMMSKLEDMGKAQKDAHETLNGTIMGVRDNVISIQSDVKNLNNNMNRNRTEFRESIKVVHERVNITDQDVAKNQQAIKNMDGWVEKIDKKTESNRQRISTTEIKLGVTKKKKNGLTGRDWAYIIGAIAAAVATISGAWVAYSYNQSEEPTPIIAPEIPE